MRWLLHKDLLILGRSRLLLALLIVYPVAIALLIGFAISRSPSRPRVAIVDETPPGETVRVGNERVSIGQYARQLFSQVQPVSVLSGVQVREATRKMSARRPSPPMAQRMAPVMYAGFTRKLQTLSSSIGPPSSVTLSRHQRDSTR